METPSIQFTPEQVQQAREVISRAVADLGALSLGQTTDLLLDNLSWIPGVSEAKLLVIEAMES